VKYFELDMHNDLKLQNLSSITSIVELCQGLVKTEKSKTYYLIDRLIRLVLTLSVSTTTIKRAFSAMKVVKTRRRILSFSNEMERNRLVISRWVKWFKKIK
jgi:hypothetical protein